MWNAFQNLSKERTKKSPSGPAYPRVEEAQCLGPTGCFHFHFF